MRAWRLGLVVLCPALGCGESDAGGGTAPGAAASAGQSVSGAGGVASAGKGGFSAGGSSAGALPGGASGGPTGGNSSAGGGAAGAATGGSEPGEAGAPAGGGASGSSECNPRKVMCKIVQPQCPANQVPSVDGTCWGPCVKIEDCACQSADDCPDMNQYTCWSQQHCGPFVK